MRKVTHADIQNKAAALLAEYNIKKAPVDVEDLAERLGAVVKFAVLDDELSGMVYINEGTPIIGVNALHHPNRQRFTIAHEIAHLILHREEITKEVHVDKNFKVFHRDSKASKGIDVFEIQANQFAAEILMPRTLVLSALKNINFDMDDESLFEELADDFEVSKQALEYRVSDILRNMA